jgi:hypothetical protein
MNIYLVSRTDDWGYDHYDSFVCAAPDEETAKQLNVAKSFYDRSCKEKSCEFMTPEDWNKSWTSWTNSPDNLEVEFIGRSESDEIKIILASYNAG